MQTHSRENCTPRLLLSCIDGSHLLETEARSTRNICSRVSDILATFSLSLLVVFAQVPFSL
jgi:hypothetical protein